MKRKRKKERKEKKRSVGKKIMPRIELGTYDEQGQSFTTRARREHKKNLRNFIIKTFQPY